MRRLFHWHRNEEVARLGKMADAGVRPNPEVSTLDGIGKPRLQEAPCAAPFGPRTRRFDAAAQFGDWFCLPGRPQYIDCASRTPRCHRGRAPPRASAANA